MIKPSEVNIKRYAELDVFRGLAIISVLLFHYTTRYDQLYGYTEMPFSFPYGHLGVQLFFMISGFVIYMGLENIKDGSDFIVKRISRLYPAYWASIGITFSLVAIFTLPGRQVPLYDALINLSMLQSWISGVKQVDGSYWALSRFIAFYIIIFLIHKFHLKQKIIQICIVWLLLMCISKTADNIGFSISSKIKLTFLLIDGSFFILGIMFYMIKKYGNKSSFYFVIFCCHASIYFVNGRLLFVAALVFSFLFVLFSTGSLEFINIKPLKWLGGVSYSLYLVHQNIGYIVINKLKILDINFVLIIMIAMAISLSIAAMVDYYIEKPALKMLRAKLSTTDSFPGTDSTLLSSLNENCRNTK